MTRALVLLAVAVACAGCGGKKEESGPTAPTQHFITRPDLKPPVVRVVKRASNTAPGYIFIAPKKKVAQAGPLILDDAGNVVWFHPLDTHGVTDFRVQRYRGRPALTWWRGAATTHGIGTAGGYVIADESYRVVAFVTARKGLTGDIHEFLLTPQNTALFTVYHKLNYDLSPLGGPKNGELWEAVVQEVDVATGKLLFEWHSLPHVAVGESYEHVAEKIPYDYFHINSVEPDGPDRLLISGRHVNAIYEIRKSDGAVLWRLGGKKSDFTMGRGAHFAWQHDARRLNDGTISLFDNAAEHPGEAKESKVLVLRLDETKHTATLVRNYTRPTPLLSTSQGNAQFLPGGHVLVGWAQTPALRSSRATAASSSSWRSGTRTSTPTGRSKTSGSEVQAIARARSYAKVVSTSAGTARRRWRAGGSSRAESASRTSRRAVSRRRRRSRRVRMRSWSRRSTRPVASSGRRRRRA